MPKTFTASGHSKYRLSLGYGQGYRFGKPAKGTNQEYIKDIRLGDDVSADASLYINPVNSLGLKYTYFLSAGSAPNVLSNINIHYIGPVFYTHLPLKSERSKLLYGASLGYIIYRDDGWLNSEKTLIKGGSAGALLELAYDFKIGKAFYIGAKTSLTGGVLSRVSQNGVKKDLGDDKESLVRASFNIGIRYAR